MKNFETLPEETENKSPFTEIVIINNRNWMQENDDQQPLPKIERDLDVWSGGPWEWPWGGKREEIIKKTEEELVKTLSPEENNMN